MVKRTSCIDTKETRIDTTLSLSLSLYDLNLAALKMEDVNRKAPDNAHVDHVLDASAPAGRSMCASTRRHDLLHGIYVCSCMRSVGSGAALLPRPKGIPPIVSNLRV